MSPSCLPGFGGGTSNRVLAAGADLKQFSRQVFGRKSKTNRRLDPGVTQDQEAGQTSGDDAVSCNIGMSESEQASTQETPPEISAGQCEISAKQAEVSTEEESGISAELAGVSAPANASTEPVEGAATRTTRRRINYRVAQRPGKCCGGRGFSNVHAANPGHGFYTPFQPVEAPRRRLRPPSPGRWQVTTPKRLSHLALSARRVSSFTTRRSSSPSARRSSSPSARRRSSSPSARRRSSSPSARRSSSPSARRVSLSSARRVSSSSARRASSPSARRVSSRSPPPGRRASSPSPPAKVQVVPVSRTPLTIVEEPEQAPVPEPEAAKTDMVSVEDLSLADLASILQKIVGQVEKRQAEADLAGMLRSIQEGTQVASKLEEFRVKIQPGGATYKVTAAGTFLIDRPSSSATRSCLPQPKPSSRPGPGAYNVELKPKGPFFSMHPKPKDRFPRWGSPGPGAYTVKNGTIGTGLPDFTLTGKPRDPEYEAPSFSGFTSRIVKPVARCTTPGRVPATTKLRVLGRTVEEVPALAGETSPDFRGSHSRAAEERARSPGPCRYTLPACRDAPSFSIYGRIERQPRPDCTPGPGEYDPRRANNIRFGTPKFSFGFRREHLS